MTCQSTFVHAESQGRRTGQSGAIRTRYRVVRRRHFGASRSLLILVLYGDRLRYSMTWRLCHGCTQVACVREVGDLAQQGCCRVRRVRRDEGRLYLVGCRDGRLGGAGAEKPGPLAR